MGSERGLPPPEMTRLVVEVRSLTQKLSRAQMLDLADLLHDAIRERGQQRRPWWAPDGAGDSG